MVDGETKGSGKQATDPDDAETDTSGDERDPGTTDSPTGDKKKAGDENFQAAIQRAREAEKDALARARKAEKEVRERKLSKLSETDKWKAIAEENAERAGKAELKVIVDRELTRAGLKGKIADLIREAPWAIPQVAQALGDKPTWEDTINAISKHLPAYLESLAADLQPTKRKKKVSKKADTSGRNIDEERQAPPVKERSYTRQEITEIAKDPERWSKVKNKIMQNVARHGGILPR